MSKLDVKILRHKQNIWKLNYKYSIELGVFKKNDRRTVFFFLTAAK